MSLQFFKWTLVCRSSSSSILSPVRRTSRTGVLWHKITKEEKVISRVVYKSPTNNTGRDTTRDSVVTTCFCICTKDEGILNIRSLSLSVISLYTFIYYLHLNVDFFLNTCSRHYEILGYYPLNQSLLSFLKDLLHR